MVAAVYPYAKEAFLSGALDLLTGTIEIMAMSPGYVYNPAHQFLSDLTGTIQSSGSMTGIGVGGGTFIADPVTLTAVATGHTLDAVVGYKNTGTPSTSPLIWFDDGFSTLTNGGNISVTWDFIFEIPTVGSGSVPVVSAATLTASSDNLGHAVNGQALATLSATNSPTSWSIAGGSGYYAIDSAGHLTVTSAGAAGLTISQAGTPQAIVVNATNSAGTSANVTINVIFYPDGALSAGAGSPQLPSLFSGYATRPPWKVAGVDFGVGVPAGTTLHDPTAGGLPSGTSYDAGSHTVTVTTDNTIIEAWDFHQGAGIGLVIEAANVIVRKCNWLMGSNAQVPILIRSGGDNCYIGYNTIDEAGIVDSSTFGGVIYVVYSGTTQAPTVEYNDIKNAGADFIDTSYGHPVTRYNLMRNNGLVALTHPDFQQTNPFSLPSTYTPEIYFNTWINTYPTTNIGGQGSTIGDNGAPVVGTATFNNNVLIANGPGNPGLNEVCISYWIIVDRTSFQAGAAAEVKNNFADVSSAYGFAYPGSSGAGVTFANNTDLVTNTAFSNTP